MPDNKNRSSDNDLLVFLPTYNEKENVAEIVSRIKKVDIAADILFIDDSSPDGTGALLDLLSEQETGVSVIHRPSKSGIGSAHLEALQYAFENNYNLMITMDADLTHDPKDIPVFLEHNGHAGVVVGSRYLSGAVDKRKMSEKLASRLSHMATKTILGLPWDATNALRLYRLDKIDPFFLSYINSKGYAFFFESLYILRKKGVKIAEVPAGFSKRKSGSSKMRYREVFCWMAKLLSLRWRIFTNPS